MMPLKNLLRHRNAMSFDCNDMHRGCIGWLGASGRQTLHPSEVH
jgi:hypothetical protein